MSNYDQDEVRRCEKLATVSIAQMERYVRTEHVHDSMQAAGISAACAAAYYARAHYIRSHGNHDKYHGEELNK